MDKTIITKSHGLSWIIRHENLSIHTYLPTMLIVY